jgi:hypothetical protein
VEDLAAWSTESLDAWFGAWTDGFVQFATVAGVLAAAVLLVIAASATSRVRRRFWCRAIGREVEAEFEARGLCRGVQSVQRCSAFETETAISCHRLCLDPSYRRQQGPALPFLLRGMLGRRDLARRRP